MVLNSLRDTYYKVAGNYGKRLLSGLLGVAITYALSYVFIERMHFHWGAAIFLTSIITTFVAVIFERLIKYQDASQVFKLALVKRVNSMMVGIVMTAIVGYIVISVLGHAWYYAFIIPSIITFNVQFLFELMTRYQTVK